MKINSFKVTINNFDNQAMADDPIGEVARILTELVEGIEHNGLYEYDGDDLRDINGNRVGNVDCDYGDITDDDELVEVCPECDHTQESDGDGGNECPVCFAEGLSIVMVVGYSE